MENLIKILLSMGMMFIMSGFILMLWKL